MSWDNDYEVCVPHDGIKIDRKNAAAVLFYLESVDAEPGCTWIARSLLKSYDNEELWIPKWKADQLECEHD